jgi:hypothetical protein
LELLKNTWKNGFVFNDEKVKGYYLPDFGQGLIVADDETVGLELLRYKIHKGARLICIPENNKEAVQFLESLGFYRASVAPRMYLGEELKWNQEKIYSRGGGYIG